MFLKMQEPSQNITGVLMLEKVIKLFLEKLYLLNRVDVSQGEWKQ